MKKQNGLVIGSFKDAAYQSAATSERMGTIASFIVDKCPAFLDEVPTDVKEQLDQGWALRFSEITTAQGYTNDWVPVEKNPSIVVTLDYVMSFTSAEFGKLKDSNPVQHGIVKTLRDKFAKYKSNRLGDLRTAVKRLLAESQPKTRKANAMFDEYIAGLVKTVMAKRKTASQRGDVVPSEEKLKTALAVFVSSLK